MSLMARVTCMTQSLRMTFIEPADITTEAGRSSKRHCVMMKSCRRQLHNIILSGRVGENR